MRHVFLLFFSLFFSTNFIFASQNDSSSDPKAAPEQIIDLSAINENINPCDDFYRYACGAWQDKTTIPGDKNSVSRTATSLFDITEKNLNKIILSLPNEAKLKIFYQACMKPDTNLAFQLMSKKIKQIETLKNPLDLAILLGELHQDGLQAFFNFGPMADPKDSSQTIAAFAQGGLGLPEKDYYLRKDKKSLEIIKKYREHMAQMFVLAGYSSDKASLASMKVLALEKKLASYSYSLEDSFDPSKTYNPMTLENFKNEFKSLPWEIYLQIIKAPTFNQLNVAHIDFIKKLNITLSDKTLMGTFKYYLTWQLLHESAQIMGGSFEKTHFDFFGKILNGKTEISPRWKVCTRLTENALADDLGKLYVAQKSGEELRREAQKIIDSITGAFAKDLDLLDWLDENTRNAAHVKLSKLSSKLGYPNKWIDYSSMKLDQKNTLENLFQANIFTFQRELKDISKPTDRSRWQMNPWEINAYYEGSLNEFVFPLAILLPPLFDIKASMGANYGSFGGGTVGHELTHGFDNSGRQYDGDGNLKEWWSKDVEQKFEERSNCFVTQANQYEILPGLMINGKATLGENLADQGGMKIAYLALQSHLESATRYAREDKETRQLGKYNEKQQFFLSYAQSWCEKIRPEALRTQVTSDEHPPAEFRVNSIMRNMPEFGQAFSCPLGSRLYPEAKNTCSLW